jgi:hypothetical protein
MARREKTADHPSPRSSKQRHDSGYAPLASDEKNENIRALSPVKNRSAERVPEHARWICIPLTHCSPGRTFKIEARTRLPWFLEMIVFKVRS